jgi:hypothetical protein
MDKYLHLRCRIRTRIRIMDPFWIEVLTLLKRTIRTRFLLFCGFFYEKLRTTLNCNNLGVIKNNTKDQHVITFLF